VPETSRIEVQGTGDLALSLCGAAIAVSSGFVKDAFGFHLLADGATFPGSRPPRPRLVHHHHHHPPTTTTRTRPPAATP